MHGIVVIDKPNIRDTTDDKIGDANVETPNLGVSSTLTGLNIRTEFTTHTGFITRTGNTIHTGNTAHPIPTNEKKPATVSPPNPKIWHPLSADSKIGVTKYARMNGFEF